MVNTQHLLARFIAHVQADGSFMPKTNSFRYFNCNLELMNEFANLSFNLFGVKVWAFYRKSNGCYETGFSNKNVALNLKEFHFRSENWITPKFVKNGSDLIKSNYLGAFFDDESNVLFRKRKNSYDREIKMMLVNKQGLYEIKELLNSLGIDSNIYGPFKGKYYDLKISNKKNLEKFREKVGFASGSKMRKLDSALCSYLKLNREY